ncbi:hypothetical protein ACFVFQ_14550 [Streptomyces sp. NPDC057743]|uniref:hypothetical protein n=1 Tax=Streptomyces sp. NPDC057743 TaxID=3346236 RepID=UPI00369E918D
MRARLARCLAVAALGGAGVLVCTAAHAAPSQGAAQPGPGGGPVAGRPLASGLFDPVQGHGGGVVSGGGEWEHSSADGSGLQGR